MKGKSVDFSNMKDIRIWILLFFLIRLIGITNPPLEKGHNWRQSLTCMITRNFVEGGPDLLYPRIDMAGDQTGIIGSEFPFFNYLCYLCSKAFGYTHWYGRLINLLISSAGIFCFFLLSKKIIGDRAAGYAGILLLTSIWFAFSRKSMPDTFSISLVLIGLHFCSVYYSSGKVWHLLLYFIFTTLGTLCKLPAILWLVPVIATLVIPAFPKQNRLYTGFATVISMIITGGWYFIWVPHLVETYHYQLYFPKSLGEGLHEIAGEVPGLLKNFYFNAFSSYLAFACFAAGIYVFIRKYSDYILKTTAAITVVFFLFILKTGAVFPLHNYYIIPFVPVMAIIAAVFLDAIRFKVALLILIAASAEGILNQQHDFFIKQDQVYKLSLETLLDKNTSKNELIIINGGQNPQLMYMAHRKGWSVDNDVIGNQSKIKEMQSKGATVLVVDKTEGVTEPNDYHLIGSDEHFCVYRL
ncbi:MAG TPA: glycosyltransferase family 39 protein [Bacteroidia bacterium]|nr:glycosyltransferase family 39 protein [Bacteroidia bacterium]